MKQQNEFYENMQNVTASYLFYDENGYDYELAKDQIYLYDGNIGEIKKGFDGFYYVSEICGSGLYVADVPLSEAFRLGDAAVMVGFVEVAVEQ